MGTHDSVAGVAALGWVATGLLLLITLINLAADGGRIPPNSTFGIRIPPLQRSEGAWTAGHAAGVKPAAIAFCAGVCSIIGLFAPVAYWGAIAAFVGDLVSVIASAVRAANSA